MEFSMNESERTFLMKKRQAYFSCLAEKFSSFDDFIKANDLWFAIMGVELIKTHNYLTIHIQLNFTEYEDYFVIQVEENRLTVSNIIGWQDNYCCNNYLNLKTMEQADKEDIPKCFS